MKEVIGQDPFWKPHGFTHRLIKSWPNRSAACSARCLAMGDYLERESQLISNTRLGRAVDVARNLRNVPYFMDFLCYNAHYVNSDKGK